MKILALTFDAAGNLPPLLGLAEALIARGHTVEIMGHLSQASRIEAAGGHYLPFVDAPERNGDEDAPLTLGWLEGFDHAAAWDFLSAARRHAADVLMVDVLLAASMDAAIGSRWPAVAFAHAPYEILANFMGGRFRPGLEASDLVVVTSYAAFHAGPHVPQDVVFSGPLRPRPFRTAASDAAWTRRHPSRPLILASLSTGQQSQRPALERLCEALAGLDAEVLVTIGPAMSPDGLAAGPFMSLERVVPHEAVLPMADLVVTHAGHGTVCAALVAGVPMLCLPGGGDQPFNADRVVELGLGQRLDASSASETISEAIRRLLADRALRRRARAFAAVVAAEPGPMPAIERIEALT